MGGENWKGIKGKGKRREAAICEDQQEVNYPNIIMMKFLVLIALFGLVFSSPRGGKCSQNETFRQCGTACEPSCNNPTPICTRQCINNVCQCSDGFLRDTSTNQCVPQDQCPNTGSTPSSQQCQANETFRECGTACEPSCSNPEPQICTMQCIINVCQCSAGFVRGSSGCVRRSEC